VAAPPLPLLLVLEPTHGAWPWDVAVSLSACTLQVRRLAEHLEQPSVRATLTYALALQQVEGIVVCGQGPTLQAATALEPLGTALSGAVNRLCRAQGRFPPALETLWLDESTGALQALEWGRTGGALRTSATPGPGLQRLLHALEARGEGPATPRPGPRFTGWLQAGRA
jgi:hypothetical protein